MPSNVTMKNLLETGVHFGHRTRKWNAKMKPYIFAERNGIHILDLRQTLEAVNESYDLIRDTVASGGTILFVGSKRQAQDTIKQEADRCGMPYVNERWLGGTLTNWRTIRQRIDHLKNLEARRDRGEFELLTKKEALTLTREIDKLNYRLGGIREMTKLPNLLFVVGIKREYTAVHEANILNIPIVALVDTNCDPDDIDYVIPSNDDAIRAIKLLVNMAANAVVEGENLRESVSEDTGTEEEGLDFQESADDEDFLGASTLAKLKELTFEDEEAETEESEKTEEVEAAEETEAVETPEAAEATEEEAPADAEEKTEE